jgi:hypothetical protein
MATKHSRWNELDQCKASAHFSPEKQKRALPFEGNGLEKLQENSKAVTLLSLV